MIEANIKKDATLSNINLIIKLFMVIITIFIITFILYGMKIGIFHDKTLLIDYIKKFGVLAPIFFIILQIIQVIFPIVPGGASCLAGVLAFGSIMGFVYNYIGLMIGSCIAYYLAKKYGLALIRKIFKEETVEKYLKYIQKNYFSKIFWISIFLPGLPDDLLCYVAGISGIRFKKFLVILLLGKPIALFMYSFFMELL